MAQPNSRPSIFRLIRPYLIICLLAALLRFGIELIHGWPPDDWTVSFVALAINIVIAWLAFALTQVAEQRRLAGIRTRNLMRYNERMNGYHGHTVKLALLEIKEEDDDDDDDDDGGETEKVY